MHCSLKVKSMLVLALALAGAVLFYTFLNTVGFYVLDRYYTEDYVARKSQQAADAFQQYVTENKIASTDKKALRAWSREHSLLYFVVLVDGSIAYESIDVYDPESESASEESSESESAPAFSTDGEQRYGSAESELDAALRAAELPPGGTAENKTASEDARLEGALVSNEGTEGETVSGESFLSGALVSNESTEGETEAYGVEGDSMDAYIISESEYAQELYTYTENLYDIRFADRSAKLYLMGNFEYRVYTYANYIEIGLSGLFCILLFVCFLQRKIRYLQLLQSEIRILEGGGMDKQITVRGHDEVAELAFALDQMRRSLNENIREKEELLQANNSLVTGMAHDLRTPLTALLLYTELLSQGKYANEEEMKQYLNKTASKAGQIKRMSDQLFERFYISGKDKVVLEAPEPLASIVENECSDMVMFLESQGFRIVCDTDWPDVAIAVFSEYLDRIMDNIASNLQKYADPAEPVVIRAEADAAEHPNVPGETYAALCIRNRIKASTEGIESTCVGVINISLMMRRMQGDCRVKNDGTHYEIQLLFPVSGEERR